MLWTAVVVAAVTAAEPCEPPRVRDAAPLVAALSQDKALGLALLKAGGLCAERGEACDQARLECTTLLNQVLQKQAGFDEGQWLRDMLLPFNGATYAPSRPLPAAQLAGDASCNLEAPVLEAAAQKRLAQAARREGLLQEYQLYARWTQVQLQSCKDRVVAEDAKAAQAKAEAERLAAAAAAASAAEALKLQQAREAAQATLEVERRAKEAAEAQARQEREAKEALEAQARERKQADQRAREERDEAAALRLREKREADEEAAREKEEAERKAKEVEEKRLVNDRDKHVAEQRAYKSRVVAEAEANLRRAQEQELLKKQLAVDVLSASPAVAQAAVAEAAAAERDRLDAEKKLAEARQRAEAVIIDDSFERSPGSALVAGGVSALDSGLALTALGAFHFGFWGAAPSRGMASGLELRLWGRYSATLTGPAAQTIDSLLTARYFFGHLGLGLAGELRMLQPSSPMPTLLGGAGPGLAAAFIDDHVTRVILGVNYLVLGTLIDPLRLVGDLEVSWRFLTLHVVGGTQTRVVDGLNTVGWQLGAALGLRAAW